MDILLDIPERNGQILRYSLPKLNQEEIENMNRSITSTKIETVIQFSSVQPLSHV